MFAWIYFGSLLPNTYAAKAVKPDDGFFRGLRYLPGALQATFDRLHPRPLPTLLVLVEAALILVGAVVVWQEPERRRWRYAVVACAAQALFILDAGGDWMPYGRFVAPVVLPMVALQTVGIGWCVARARARARRGWALAGVAVLLALVGLSVAMPYTRDHASIWSTPDFGDAALVASGRHEPGSTVGEPAPRHQLRRAWRSGRDRPRWGSSATSARSSPSSISAG